MPRRKKKDAPPTEIAAAPVIDPAEAEEIARLRAMTPDQRADQVMRWLTAGHRDLDIVETVAKAWPDAKGLLDDVLTKLQKAGETPPDFIRGWIYAGRLEIYRQLMEIGDHAGALRALKDIEAAAK